jgi:hypothetical protein
MRHKSGLPAAPSTPVRPAGMRNAHQPASIHFSIGRITLHGYSSADQRRFTNSLQRSLGELVESHHDYDWSATSSLKIRKLSGGTLNPGASPEEAATHVARKIVQHALQLSGGRHDA